MSNGWWLAVGEDVHAAATKRTTRNGTDRHARKARSLGLSACLEQLRPSFPRTAADWVVGLVHEPLDQGQRFQ